MANLLRYASRMDLAPWDNHNITMAYLGPDNGSPSLTSTRMIVIANPSGDYQGSVQRGIPEYVQSRIYTASVWYKAETLDAVMVIGMRLAEGANDAITNFNPSTHAFVSALPSNTGQTPWTSVRGGVESLPNAWHRAWVQGVSPPLATSSFQFYLASSAMAVGKSYLVAGVALYQGTNDAFSDSAYMPNRNQFLATFDFPFHTFSTRYPTNSTVIQFGGSYSFASRPISPPQRTFTLEFKGMRWFQDVNDNTDVYTKPQHNLGAMDQFYQDHQLWKAFFYPHPTLGTIPCRFAKPLEVGRQLEGGGGVVAPFTVELIEVP